MIMGIDEVGRGPWAGPLVVGAVVLPDGLVIDGLTDSKKLTAKRRMALDTVIREQALGWGLGWVHADELDEVGLSAALRLATIRAVEAVKVPYHEIIIDGTINFLKQTTKGSYVTTMPKADFLVPAVSAASIIAKVARDAHMAEQDVHYPGYGFASHVGYGTAQHSEALAKDGVTPLHRKSFAPIAKLLAKSTRATPVVKASSVTVASQGRAAELRVAAWLQENGFIVREQNWKTKWCEIDIVAEDGEMRYFIEVKYRSSNDQGGGLAAITAKKHQQMLFAAELYSAHHPTLKNIQLAVVAASPANQFELLAVE